MMISARGLSLARMIRSMTSTTGAVARTVIVLAVLLGSSVGCTGIVGMRMIVLITCASSDTSACEM